MKILLAVAVIAAFVMFPVAAMATPVKIALLPSSFVPFSKLAVGLEKKECSGVVLTLDKAKADYLLEATTSDPFPTDAYEHAEFTLFSTSGEILFHTSTRLYKNAMKDVCVFITKGKR